jgi:hypothetical protein
VERNRAYLSPAIRFGAGLLLATVLAVGCGSSSTGGGADPSKVASSLAGFVAKIAANEDHPATAAQVDALRRRLAVACAKPLLGQYPCTVRRHGRPGAEQGCVAFVDRSDHVVSARCRSDAGPPPVVRAGYVDCKTVGHVVAVHDAADDTLAVLAGAPSVKTNAPWADLTEVRVAATPSRFCVDFRTGAPPRHWTRFSLLATRPRVAPYQDNFDFEPIIDYSDPRLPEVQLFSNSAISGQVGSSGGWTSLLITSADIGSERAAFLRAPFMFRAFAEYVPRIPGRISARPSDQAPDGHQQAAYP